MRNEKKTFYLKLSVVNLKRSGVFPIFEPLKKKHFRKPFSVIFWFLKKTILGTTLTVEFAANFSPRGHKVVVVVVGQAC